MCICLHTGIVVERLISVICIVGTTLIPIELTCNVTGLIAWRVYDRYYSLTDLTNGVLPYHSRNGTNILVNNPKNNTEYICVSTTSASDPAYIIMIGE